MTMSGTLWFEEPREEIVNEALANYRAPKLAVPYVVTKDLACSSHRNEGWINPSARRLSQSDSTHEIICRMITDKSNPNWTRYKEQTTDKID